MTISSDPPFAVGVACAVVGSAILSFESATLLERARRGDTSKTFFPD